MRPDRKFERSYDKDESSRNRWPFHHNPEDEEDILLKKKESSKTDDKKSNEKPEQKNEKSTADKKAEDEKKTETEAEKKDKRTEIVERSQALKKLYEDEPAPQDPDMLARLIVAERIVSLDKQLQQPDQDTVRTPAELEEVLDYMCLLAEKLEEPEVESLPEIKEAYEEILELTEAVLDMGEDPNELVLDIDEQLQQLLVNENPQEEHSSHTSPTIPLEATTRTTKAIKVAALVAVFAKIIHPTRKITSQEAYIPTSHEVPSASLFPNQPKEQIASGKYEEMSGSDYPTETTPTYERPFDKEKERFYRPPAHNASEYHVTASGRDHVHPLATLAVASVIATSIHKGPESSVAHSRHEVSKPEAAFPFPQKIEPAKPISSSELSSPQHEEPVPLISYSEQVPAITPDHLRMNFERQRETIPKPIDIVHREADRKLEHMTTHALLTLAHGVHLGYGQYLKDEFEKGAIDKDGLIKVLKARAKGKDFSREFREQAAHYRLLKSSPEFLHEDRQHVTLPIVSSDTSVLEDAERTAYPIVKDVKPSQSPQQASSTNILHTSDEDAETETRDEKKADANSLWIIAIIVGVIILGALLWTLL